MPPSEIDRYLETRGCFSHTTLLANEANNLAVRHTPPTWEIAPQGFTIARTHAKGERDQQRSTIDGKGWR
jgi:hypothetical protein